MKLREQTAAWAGLSANGGRAPANDGCGPAATAVPGGRAGLDTPHRHLVFVFVSQGELNDAYFKPSESWLAKGYSLKTAAVAVPRKQPLASVLAQRMPSGKRFRVVVEGTPDFNVFMEELRDDTISPGECEPSPNYPNC